MDKKSIKYPITKILGRSTVVILILLINLILISCNNDEEDQLPASILLIGEGWELRERTVSPPYGLDSEPSSDLYQFVAYCMRDDKFIFNADRSVIYDDWNILCGTDESRIQQGTWELTDDNRVLTIRFGPSESKWTINSISENRLIINEAPRIIDSVTYTYTRVYKR